MYSIDSSNMMGIFFFLKSWNLTNSSVTSGQFSMFIELYKSGMRCVLRLFVGLQLTYLKVIGEDGPRRS